MGRHLGSSPHPPGAVPAVLGWLELTQVGLGWAGQPPRTREDMLGSY